MQAKSCHLNAQPGESRTGKQHHCGRGTLLPRPNALVEMVLQLPQDGAVAEVPLVSSLGGPIAGEILEHIVHLGEARS